MILCHGKIYDDSEQIRIINSLKEELYKPFEEGVCLDSEKVINACDSLAKRILGGEFDEQVKPLLEMLSIDNTEYERMVKLFSKEKLEYKCSIELCDEEMIIDGRYLRKRCPLGVLMHIAAGNADVLPAYSVIEGLLSGNINILKLPSGDSGLSIKLLYELVKIEPELADYIYVFDVPSTETETLKTLADYSDGIVVWGGDVAVKAARRLASPSTKIISWGHKLSFAYAEIDVSDNELRKLAKHICRTNQVLCSSCQGIYVNTKSKEEQLTFGERFFEILKEVNREQGAVDLGLRAKNAISIYNERLESHSTKKKIMWGDGVSVICSDDKALELSFMYRNVWIKRLAPEEIVSTLKPYKGYLQTVGLLCDDVERQRELKRLFVNAGVVRINRPGEMSRTVSGEAHDGLYPLREYTKIVECFLPRE